MGEQTNALIEEDPPTHTKENPVFLKKDNAVFKSTSS